MQLCTDITVQFSRILCLFLLLITKCKTRKTQTYFMDRDCGTTNTVSGATIYSHSGIRSGELYPNSIDCLLKFKAENGDYKLMLRFVDLDIPDLSYRELCNDAVYVYDANSIFGRAFRQAGGTAGLCGSVPPPVIFSTGPYLTISFRTDGSGRKGSGFKLIITAFSQEAERYQTCGNRFKCGTTICIDNDLVCDNVNHCGDQSDELGEEGTSCGKPDEGIISKFLSLGITAAIAITVGSVVVFVVCVVCVICCCCRCMRKRNQDPGGDPVPTTTATNVTINNGGPPMPMGATPGYLHNYGQHAGYYPMQAVHQGPPSVTYSPFPNTRESYNQSQGSYSSQAPPSYHRSYTPTSSRSGGRSHHSGEGSVKYAHDKEKVALPVHV